ncbi:Platelet-activating factor acetylhydrolase like protein [Argiope bruennichi]|uniref:1-alkyl-2-acetylglycerophosphocholine esterase n=1 Tax=Argiope bruennichi TaxID=94029 RepID=A0A8T0FPT0_ARGBR|nr:Platelet-activating factor acetylhydrolase like protein [Argiope bruennichi]
MEERVKSLTYKGRRHLPLPTGPFTVGCTDVMTSYLKFGVFVRLYYPSRDQGILDRYLQWPLWLPHKEYLNGYSVRLGIPSSIFRFLHQILVGKLYIPAVWHAALRQSDEKYPVVVFSHGLSGWRTVYSSLCLELASYGFVVAAVEHRDYSASASFYKKQVRMSASGTNPGASLCDLDDLLNDQTDFVDGKWDPGQGTQDTSMRSRQVKYRAKECMEVLDLLEDLNKGRYVVNVLESNIDSGMFYNQLDLKNAFFIGHSFGGSTGILCLATELRFKAGIFLDPWMLPFFEDQSCFSMISQPFLCLLVKSFQTKKSLEILKNLQDMHSQSQFYFIKDADHRDLCDTPFVNKYSLSLSSKVGLRIERFAALELMSDLIFQYLGHHLGKSIRSSSSKIESLKKKFLRSEEYFTKLIA